MTTTEHHDCSPRLSPCGTYYIHEASCAYAKEHGLPREPDQTIGEALEIAHNRGAK